MGLCGGIMWFLVQVRTLVCCVCCYYKYIHKPRVFTYIWTGVFIVGILGQDCGATGSCLAIYHTYSMTTQYVRRIVDMPAIYIFPQILTLRFRGLIFGMKFHVISRILIFIITSPIPLSAPCFDESGSLLYTFEGIREYRNIFIF